ncbi:recombinase family protein [Rhodococcus aetherivorans]|uniref:recombinase family protein n=1 Tax=Rhodococcus aetherivorans TaxID=191292 RepID=UPI00045CB18D|nr:recombinase family protein [Rhodococcus aetherivorans]KDE10125.1 resolvase [Rhodococcus aetherivorans]
MARKRIADQNTVVAYLRVSTEEQAVSGAGLAAQRATIEAEARRRGWTIAGYYSDEGISGKAIANRPQLAQAIAAVESGEAGALVVAKLDRLSRSVADASNLLDRASRSGWRIFSADLAIDTTTPAGEAAASMMIVFSQLERRLISQRTKDALAVKRAQGVRLGRPSVLAAEVVARIVRERTEGRGLRVIAEGLTADGVPTARGKAKWSTSSVQSVLAGQDAAVLAQ